jgi:hypothetical protein
VTTDWQQAWSFFDLKPVKNILEFGLGIGTHFLLEKADYVKSFEIDTGYANDWISIVRKECRHPEKWDTEVIICENKYKGNIKRATRRILKERDWDIILVDPGCNFRGELVQESFGHAPIIIAHDTNAPRNVYGYNEIKKPDNYVLTYIPNGEGTGVWRLKDE